MLVFLTGAAGFVGSHVLTALIAAGHDVVALVRSEQASQTAKSAGAAKVVVADLSDESALREAVAGVDAIVHTALDHRLCFGAPGGAVKALENDRDACKTMCDALVASSSGNGKPKTFLHASGLLGLVNGPDEKAEPIENPAFPRHLSDSLVQSYADKGLLRAHIVRLAPLVHAAGHENFFAAYQIAVAKQQGFAAYVGSGEQVWNAVHVKDAAQVYVKALEGGAPAGSTLHAIAEEVIPLKQLAEFIAQKLGVEAKSVSHQEAMQSYGFVGAVMGIGQRQTAEHTKKILDWEPKEPGFFSDFEGYAF